MNLRQPTIKKTIIYFAKFNHSDKCNHCGQGSRDSAAKKYKLVRVNCNDYQDYVNKPIEIITKEMHVGKLVNICKVIDTNEMLVLTDNEIATK